MIITYKFNFRNTRGGVFDDTLLIVLNFKITNHIIYALYDQINNFHIRRSDNEI